MSTAPDVQFYFESDRNHGYVPVLANSTLVSGSIVSQNAGSTNGTIYYQVGGGGLNGVFSNALGNNDPRRINNPRTDLDDVNDELTEAYDRKFGAGSWQRDSNNPPSPVPLTSLLVQVRPGVNVGEKVVGMVYSVGPMLDPAGLTASLRSVYIAIYTDAMNEIAASPTKIDAFRITMLSSGIYLNGAPIEPFADAAAGCIIDAVRTAVKAKPAALARLAILINTDTNAEFTKELNGFTNAATARGAKVTRSGFSLPTT